MNTLHLRYALEVARTGSITQAADNLFMGQPNLSKAIRELEDALGLSIFRRTSKGVVPTERGVEFLRSAKRVLQEVEQMEALGKGEEKGAKPLHIIIPCSGYLSAAAFSYLAQPATNGMATGTIDVKVEERDAMTAANAVIEGNCSFAILRIPERYEPCFLDFFRARNLAYEPIWEFEQVALTSKKHPCAANAIWRENTYDGLPEIICGEDTVPYLPQEERLSLLRQERETPHTRLCAPSCWAAYSLLGEHRCAYLRESPQSPDLLARWSLLQHRLPLEEKRKDVLVYQHGCPLGEKEYRFLDAVYAAKNRAALQDHP